MRTYRRWLNHGKVHYDKRAGSEKLNAMRKLSKEEESEILSVCNEDRFSSLPPSQIVPKLLDEGLYIASESSFYRVLRKNKQLQRRGRSLKRHRQTKPSAFKATKPNEVYTWDITYLPTHIKGSYFYLYTFMDVYSRKIVGCEVYERESGDLATILLDRILRVEGCLLEAPVVHSDNGAPMTSATLNARMQELGVISSFSRSHVSNDNPYSESLFRTLKYVPDYPYKGFNNLDEARAWVQKFTYWYNNEHQHSKIRFITPNQRHQGLDDTILAKRKQVLLEAKNRHPDRFPNGIRRCDKVGTVWLNPDKDDVGNIVDKETLKKAS